MKKEVFVSITGIQVNGEGEEQTEILAPGEYYYKNGTHYLFYDEKQEGDGSFIKCKLKITQNLIELTKESIPKTIMVFCTGEETTSHYQTPYGSILLGISTKKIELLTESSEISAAIDYSLHMNGSYLSDCRILILVKNQ